MRKKMTASFLLWLFFLLLIAVMAFWTNSVYGWGVIGAWIALPILTWVINVNIRKKLKVKILVKPTASKGEESPLSLILENTGVLAVGKAFCQLEFHNSLTGERRIHTVEISVRPKGSSEGILQMTSAHCGYIRIKLVKTVLTDCFGFLPVKCHVTANRKIDILPEMFQTQVSLQMNYAMAEDALSWSEIRKGDDFTELFALRDYVEGDSMKQIHWKLSSKRNMLIVKEASQPTTKSLLLFWDKNAMESTPEEMDTMAEVVASISQAIMENGIQFTLGWTEEQSCMYEEVESEEQLIQVLPRMLKEGAEPGENTFLVESLQKKGNYGKIIYFAKTMPEYIEVIRSENMSFVLCDCEAAAEGVCTFSPDTYVQDMEIVEL